MGVTRSEGAHQCVKMCEVGGVSSMESRYGNLRPSDYTPRDRQRGEWMGSVDRRLQIQVINEIGNARRVTPTHPLQNPNLAVVS
jgi:hypothetical protein